MCFLFISALFPVPFTAPALPSFSNLPDTHAHTLLDLVSPSLISATSFTQLDSLWNYPPQYIGQLLSLASFQFVVCVLPDLCFSVVCSWCSLCFFVHLDRLAVFDLMTLLLFIPSSEYFIGRSSWFSDPQLGQSTLLILLDPSKSIFALLLVLHSSACQVSVSCSLPGHFLNWDIRTM